MRKAAAMRKIGLLMVSVAILSLSGCVGAFDPFQRPGQWAETGASNETIAQQAAYPSDLSKGQSESTSNGIVASGALDKALGAGGTGSATGLQSTISTSVTAGSISVGN
jgi:hypothetical protein